MEKDITKHQPNILKVLLKGGKNFLERNPILVALTSATFTTIKSMEWELSPGQEEANTKESFGMTYSMERGSCTTRTGT